MYLCIQAHPNEDRKFTRLLPHLICSSCLIPGVNLSRWPNLDCCIKITAENDVGWWDTDSQCRWKADAWLSAETLNLVLDSLGDKLGICIRILTTDLRMIGVSCIGKVEFVLGVSFTDNCRAGCSGSGLDGLDGRGGHGALSVLIKERDGMMSNLWDVGLLRGHCLIYASEFDRRLFRKTS